MISGVGTIAILFLIRTSLQLHGYTVCPTGGQNHMLMKPVPWATRGNKGLQLCTFGPDLTDLNTAGRIQRPETSSGTPDCTFMPGWCSCYIGEANPTSLHKNRTFVGIITMGHCCDSDLGTRDARRHAVYQTALLRNEFLHMTFKGPVGHRCMWKSCLWLSELRSHLHFTYNAK